VDQKLFWKTHGNLDIKILWRDTGYGCGLVCPQLETVYCRAVTDTLLSLDVL